MISASPTSVCTNCNTSVDLFSTCCLNGSRVCFPMTHPSHTNVLVVIDLSIPITASGDIIDSNNFSLAWPIRLCHNDVPCGFILLLSCAAITMGVRVVTVLTANNLLFNAAVNNCTPFNDTTQLLSLNINVHPLFINALTDNKFFCAPGTYHTDVIVIVLSIPFTFTDSLISP